MNFRFHNLNEEAAYSGHPSDTENGLLKIEVPHWASLVEICDDSFKPVSKQEPIHPDPGSASHFSTEASLKPGIYLIKITLGSKTEESWVPVQASRVTHVDASAWNELQFTSAIPVQNPGFQQQNPEIEHVEAAEEYSKKKTWKDSEGNSNLFLFLRATEPPDGSSASTQSEDHVDGLQLLTCTGRPIPEFSERVEVEKEKGWIAFNADLPAGGYILRQGRRGLRLRYQVLYLCPNWQTQIFIKSKGLSYPYLKAMSLSMSRKTEGFRRDDESDIASEAILKGLRFNTNLKRLFANKRIRKNLDVLIDEKHGNPWLGILAAHAILRLNLEFGAVTPDLIADEDFTELREYLAICEGKIVPFLKNHIPMHPDVQALLLTDENPSNYPFIFPPSLWISLRRAQSHSAKYSETIPKDCLTDCILDSLLFDSPWTTWRYLTRSPVLWEPGIELEPRLRPPTSKKIAIKKSPDRLRESENVLAGDALGFEPSLSSKPINLNDLTVNQLAKELTSQYENAGNVQEIPIETTADTTSKIGEILEQVSPKEVSAAYNLPLSRTEHELETLKRRINTQADPESDFVTGSADTGTGSASVYAQNAILDLAIKQSAPDALLSMADIEQYFNDLSTVRTEELAGKIRTCAERLWATTAVTVDSTTQSQLQTAQPASRNDSEMNQAPVLAQRLKTMASRLKTMFDSLLSASTFVVLTDSQQKIFEKNDAFLHLLIPRELGAQSTADLIDHVANQQKKWEGALASLSIGTSEIPDPAEPNTAFLFKVKRSIVKDEKNDIIHAHINVVRMNNYSEIPAPVLEKVNSRLPDLTLYSSLVSYGSIEDRRNYSSLLEEVIVEIEDLTKRGQ